jgi:hypothetical protein
MAPEVELRLPRLLLVAVCTVIVMRVLLVVVVADVVGEVDAVDVVLVIVPTSATLAAESHRELFTAGSRVPH